MGTRPIRILGIDPGLRRTGWGMVAIEGNRLSFLACGSVASDDKAALSLRLVSIHNGLQQVVAAHAPDAAAVEEVIARVGVSVEGVQAVEAAEHEPEDRLAGEVPLGLGPRDDLVEARAIRQLGGEHPC